MSRRLVVAILCALGAHIALFYLYIPDQTHIVHPEPLVVQRIAVSLGSRPAIENQPEQIPIAVPEPEPEPIIAPPKPPSEPTPILKPVLKPVLKKKLVSRVTRPSVHKSQTVKKPVNREVSQNQQVPSGVETEEDKDQKEQAVRVIQEASPLYQLNPPPRYPRLARRRGYEGLVVLEVDVDRYGRPVTVTLFAGSGYSLLDKAALEAVGKWRFQPGTIDGIPEKMVVKVPIRFRLDDE